MVNEFRDPVALKKKKVRFVPYFEQKGMTLEMFHKAVPKEYLTSDEDVRPETQPVASGDGVAESEPAIPVARKGTGRAKK